MKKQLLLFDQWHAARRKYITLACFMASYCELALCAQPPGIQSCDLNICESDAQLVAHISNASQLVPLSRRCVALRPPPPFLPFSPS